MTGIWTNGDEVAGSGGEPCAVEGDAALNEFIKENPQFPPPSALDLRKPPG